MATKKLYIQTFGCQMNVHDSEQIATLLRPHGYEPADRPAEADVILVNTCSIREKAAQKAYSQLGRYSLLKKRKPELLIAVGGCLAQQYGRKILKRVPLADLIFGTHNNHLLPDLLARAAAGRSAVVETAFRESVPSIGFPAEPDRDAVSAFVTIMQGCNNFCSYCVVPHLRGREESRPMAEILREVEGLAGQGIREVTLLGQNVNSYGRTLPAGNDFPELIRAIGEVPGIERIRFTTSHPKDLSPRLIACFGELDSLCEHIHLPVQSGSDRVLRRMNRGYTVEAYLGKMASLRRSCPEIAITSDVIVGFPGESEEDFQQTLGLMREIRFDNLFSFQYSEREGTAAAGMDNPVSDEVKRERLRTLQALQEEHTLQKNRARVGKREEILVEGVSRDGLEDMMGRTRGNRIVNFPGTTDLIGKIISVRIVDAFLHSLRGETEKRGGADVH